jgi:predicted NBD/HSP70 family sugar kinase
VSVAKRTPEGVRKRNLGCLLRLVHLEGPLSRAQLTEITGLNRSTIADLVGDLSHRGLVREVAPDLTHRVGRPSPIVVASPDVVAIAANPEVDALTVAVVGFDQSMRVRSRIEMDHLLTPGETVESIARLIDSWADGALADARIVGVGLAVPGLVRATDGTIRIAPHLRWADVPLPALVTAATGLPAVAGNDANLGALAEHLFGAARGVDDVVYLNGGASGIGGGLIVNGRSVGGAGGYAGEFGQNRPGIAVDTDRRTDHGVLEDEVSRRRLLDVIGLAAADDPTLASALHAATSQEVADELARQRRILATALANAVNVLDPRMVVLGGFLAMIADLDLHELEADVQACSMPAPVDDLKIRTAILADDRLLIGAAEVMFAELLNDPFRELH